MLSSYGLLQTFLVTRNGLLFLFTMEQLFKHTHKEEFYLTCRFYVFLHLTVAYIDLIYKWPLHTIINDIIQCIMVGVNKELSKNVSHVSLSENYNCISPLYIQCQQAFWSWFGFVMLFYNANINGSLFLRRFRTDFAPVKVK